MLPSSSKNKWQTKRQRKERKRGTGVKKKSQREAGSEVGCGSPLVPPALPWPSSRGLLEPWSLWRQRGIRLLVQGGQRLQQDPHLLHLPDPSPRTERSRKMVGPGKMGDPVLTQSPDPKAQADPHHPGRVLPALQEAPTVSRPQAPQHVSPTSFPALPPTWAWPCPGPMGGASHPVHPCAGRGGPGQSPPAPASTAHSPSPPLGAPTLAGGELSVPGLDSGAPRHPARKRHSELWGRSGKCP